MSDITPVTRGEGLLGPPPERRVRKRRFRVVALGAVAALGLGLAGGANLHRLVDLDTTSAWLAQAAGVLHSGWEAARAEIGRRIETYVGRPVQAAQVGPEAGSARLHDDGLIERAVGDLSLRVEQIRAATDGSARDLGAGIERVQGSAEQNHRELVAKLAQLAERMERIERQTVAATSAASQPVAQQAAPPPMKPQAKAAPGPAPDAQAKAVPKPAAPKAKPETPGIDAKGIANWTVRNVFGDTAVLDGPRGLVEVTLGDVVPGIGRVQAIMRSGRRWIVATTKGVITPQ